MLIIIGEYNESLEDNSFGANRENITIAEDTNDDSMRLSSSQGVSRIRVGVLLCEKQLLYEHFMINSLIFVNILTQYS